MNLTNGHRYKFNQARRLVEHQCALAWVQFGVSVRELTVDEMVKARSEQARTRELGGGIVEPGVVYGLRFVAPPNTRWEVPWAAYEEMPGNVAAIRYCRWPRRQFLRSVAA